MTDDADGRETVAQDENKQEIIVRFKDEEFHPHLAKIGIPRASFTLDLNMILLCCFFIKLRFYLKCINSDQRSWADRGTGHVACVSIPERQGVTFIVVRLEHGDKNVLESRILKDTIYQKQQETLIVWSESESYDLALSFQEKSGCEDIWKRICQVQGQDPGEHPDFSGNYDDVDEQDGFEGSEQSAYSSQEVTNGSITLPPCEVSQLREIELALSRSFGSAQQREKLALAIESQGYVEKLCDIFRMCEDLENLEGLHLLYQIARDMFMLNRNDLLEILLQEKYFKDIVGMLEYDPAYPERRKHREFLYEKAKFREVLPIRNEELRRKIHQTFRVQYVQEVCLPVPSIFEENLLTVLTSFLFFNRVDIVTFLQDDKQLLKDLFEQLKDRSVSVERRKDLAMFLKEFCSFSSSLQQSGQPSRESFYKTLMDNDLLEVIEPCLESDDLQTRVTIVEVFVMIVEFNPQAVRDYLLQQARNISESKNKNLLLNKLISHMLSDRDPELTSANTMAQVMRAILDPDNMIATPNAKSERQEFLAFFYRRSMETLCRPLTENTKGGILQKAALRLFRKVVQLKDDYYNRYIVRENVMSLIADCFCENGPRYNLLNSAIIELFEYIRTEDLKILITYVVEKLGHKFDGVLYVQTFSNLRIKYEQMHDRESCKEESSPCKSPSSESNSSSQWKKERQAEADELWFNDEEPEAGSNYDCWDRRDGAANGAGKTLDLENSSTNYPYSPNGRKEGDDYTPPRKSGAEPIFPSVTKKNVDDESDSLLKAAVNTTRNHGPSRIIIKMNTERRFEAHSPTGNPSPSESVVSSTESLVTAAKASSSSAEKLGTLRNSVGVIFTKKVFALVDYDESDSDDDDETGPSSSSSVGDAPSTASGQPSDHDQDDVSSTSGDHEPSPGTTETNKVESPSDENREVKASRKRSSELDNRFNSNISLLTEDGEKSLDGGAAKRLRLQSSEKPSDVDENKSVSEEIVS
uniref:SMK-1 domain-containing protein n=1 Tax=Syphacia muris TaxID=451379 RepID=A0A0N5AP18_9BILA